MLWRQGVPARPAPGAGQAAGTAECATGGALAWGPSHGNLGGGIALRGRSCLPGRTSAQALCRDVLG